jgi:outer membrane receptor protein involved in Fe transport
MVSDPLARWCRSAFIFILGAAFCILLASPCTRAQSTGGRIRGTVTDPTGAAVTGAKVTLTNQATNVARTINTETDGDYLFLEVPVGTYQIEVAQQGFKHYTRKGFALDLNQVLTIDIALQLGSTAESIEVTGAPPVVDTVSTQLGAVVNDRSSTQLPLNQRDVYELLQLQPGVQSQLGNDLFFGSDRAGVVTVNGGRGRSNNYTVNGGDGNDLFVNLPAIEPSPDSVEEFRVISNSFDAEYGRNSGAVINVVTKSGTNEFHGSVYEFFRNDVLNAHAFTFTPAPKPPFKQNQFGGTLGGPIRKDKTFFFGSYEGRRVVKGIDSQPVTVPTATELGGDFSTESPFAGTLTDASVANVLNNRPGCAAAVAAQGGLPIAAGNKWGGTYDTNGNLLSPGIFTNFSTKVDNQIPTQCFDPVAVSLMKYVPGAGGANGTIVTVPKNRDRGDQFQIRFDHALNNNQKTSIYYYFDDDNTIDPFAKFQSFGDPQGTFPSNYATRTQQINGSHTWTIGSTAVNEARFSYFREGQLKFNTPINTNAVTASCGSGSAAPFCFTGTSDTPLVTNGGTPLGTNKDYGIHSGLPNPGTVEGVPAITIGGTGLLIGNNPGGQLPQTGNTFQFADNYSKIIGNHSLKFGGDVRYQKFDQFLIFDINGSYTFATGSGGANDLNTTDAYPNYFLGLSNSYLQGSANHELVRSTSVYLFAQDSWKIRPNVTLNYGLRWEVNTPLTDSGKKVQTFRPGEVSTIYPCQLSPASVAQFQAQGIANPDCNNTGVTPVGLVFPGDKGVPSGLTNTYYKGFAPRLGLNWSPGWRDGLLGKLVGGPGKTSVSMGFGIFYNPIEQLVLEQFSAEPPFGGSETIPFSYLQTPFVGQDGTVFPNPFNGVLNPPRGQPVDWSRFLGTTYFGQFPANLRLQYSDQYNLTIKRQLPGDILLQVGYVGSQGHRLLAIYEVNETNPNTCLQLAALGQGCSQASEDGFYQFTLPAGQPFDLPYIPGGPNGQNIPCLPTHTPAGCHIVGAAGGTPITLSGLRFYSSPLCNPFTGVGCPGTPPISGIFTENTVAKSNYNSLQLLLEKRFSHGLQFQASYTFSKTLDNASSFEDALNPFNFNATYGLSKYDARNRFVFNAVWDLPIPKYDGFKGKALDGWEVSGIISLQSGFPIRITSQADNELLDSTFNFEAPGEPNLVAPFKTVNPRSTVCQFGTGPLVPGGPACVPVPGYTFDPNLFDNCDNATCPADPHAVTLGTIGNSPRAICCGPGINNTDVSFSKRTLLTERMNMEFRADIFNIWNHAQFYSVDGNVGNQGATFGQPLHIRDPRLVQFALKFRF